MEVSSGVGVNCLPYYSFLYKPMLLVQHLPDFHKLHLGSLHTIYLSEL